MEIANFAALRRSLGTARANFLGHDLADRLADTLPNARLHVAGQRMIEVDFESDTDDVLDDTIRRAYAACEDAFDLDGEWHRLSILIGGACGRAGSDDVLLAEEAEAALAEARQGVTTVRHTLDDTREASIQLTQEIDRALDRDEMVLMYQPKVHARSQAVASVEALIRWQHPERGLILPGDFITAAERGQQIDRMTLWTISRAIRDQRVLRASGHDLRVFINISGQLLADAAFVQAACKLIDDAGDASIGFEVTETSVIRDPAGAIANLKRFDAIGIRISIDDYGSGLSSLAYLKQLPASELKIDKLFVTQLTSSNRDPLIVRSTIDLAHALDMEVVAEGVETPAALALLTVMGCDLVQGFLISRPIGLDALIAFLRDEGGARAARQTRQSFLELAGAWKRG
ncbi:EAL domain-containing protein [Sphingomonas sp.]|uniref:EAL domain-containing protein n=1 Tax=Sphingomonas sp. TaxID=28214 RepID=UPI0035C82772